MEYFFFALLAVAGFVPLVVLVHRMTRGRTLERYERRAWKIALLCAIAALSWFILRVLGLLSSGEASAAPLLSAMARAAMIFALVTGVPALVALALTIVATRRQRARAQAS